MPFALTVACGTRPARPVPARERMLAMRRLPATMIPAAVLLAWSLAATPTQAQQTHRNGFETDKLFWTKSIADAAHEVVLHTSTDQGAHTGQRSEYLQLKVQNGTYLYYQYPLGKAPVGEELNGGVWIKANRPGVQLLARVILPRERDPKNLELPLTTLIRGDVYENAGRWQRVSLGRASKLMEMVKQQQ